MGKKDGGDPFVGGFPTLLPFHLICNNKTSGCQAVCIPSNEHFYSDIILHIYIYHTWRPGRLRIPDNDSGSNNATTNVCTCLHMFAHVCTCLHVCSQESVNGNDLAVTPWAHYITHILSICLRWQRKYNIFDIFILFPIPQRIFSSRLQKKSGGFNPAM